MKMKATVVAICLAALSILFGNMAVQIGLAGNAAAEEPIGCEPVYGQGLEDGGICGSAIATEQAVRLDPPVVEEPDAYRSFPSCKEAVDYLFYGRWDYSRALRVVYRESRYEPFAVSRTGAKGCAQLTGGLLNFLGGPWYDPYWNVLAMRTAVDSPKWGWCHWDIVNYCRPGGQF